MATWAKGLDFNNSTNTTRIGGIGVYGTDTIADKLYIGLGTEPWNNSGLEITSSTLNFKGNKIYHSGDKPTPSEIGAAASNHNHTSLTGVTSIAFLTDSSDKASIQTTISGTNTYFDFMLADDPGQDDQWRWRFTPSGGTEFSAMVLDATSATAASLYVAGDIYANGNKVYHTGNKPTLGDLGAAATSHTHTTVGPYMGISNTGNTNGYGISLYGGASASAPSYGLMFQGTGTFGTHGSVTGDWATYFTMSGATSRGWIFKAGNVAGGNVASISATGAVTAASFSGDFIGALSGNATTATTLQNARTINGTSFNGSANITTAIWGTPINITIGNTSKSIDGSTNINWSLAEIGASTTSHTHSYLRGLNDTRGTEHTPLSAPTEFKVTFQSNNTNGLTEGGYYSLMHIPRWTDKSGGYGSQIAFTDNENVWVRKGDSDTTWTSWKKIWHSGNFDPDSKAPTSHTHSYIPLSGSTAITGVLRTSGELQSTSANGLRLAYGNYGAILRNDGANTYFLLTASADQYGGWNNLRPWTVNNSTGVVTFGNGITGSLTGNATTATTLQNARTINGTSFNGSANITTALWGTPINVTVGNTVKSVNGSSDISWNLSEIGAASTSHTHVNLNTKGSNTINSTVNDTTANWGAQGHSIHWYTATGCLNDQPSQYGYILNLGSGNEVHQIWMTQSSGNMAHRGGNASNWNGTWRTLLDSTNYSTYAAPVSHTHSYLPLTGGTLTGDLSVTSSNPTLTIKNSSNNDSSLVFDRGTNANWRIRNTSGNLLFESDYTSTKGAYYAALTINYNSGNLTSKGTISAPTFNGSLTGNATSANTATSATTATTANYLASNSRMDYGWSGLNYFNISGTAGAVAKANDTPTTAWWHIMRLNHANATGYYTDIAVPFNDVSLHYKRVTAGTVQNGGWVKVLDSLNYNSYSPTKTGTGASGTWGISVTGNAATSTALQTARTINGTSFNGTANITTVLWGTPVNMTIGSSVKSVNGSTDVNWSLAEIGAANALDGTHKWTATLAASTWSRILYVPGNQLGSGGIISITGTRNSVVYSNIFTFNASHPGKGNITQLSAGKYSEMSARLVVDGSGNAYVELLDTAAQSIHVTFLQLGGNTGVVKYTSATSGAVIPSGFTATTTMKLNNNGINAEEIRVNDNTVYHTGRKPSPADIGAASSSHNHDTAYMRQDLLNSFWGMTANGSTSDWVRTTISGILPYQSGTTTSSLGTSAWRFKDAHIQNIYEGGVELASKYAAISHNHTSLTGVTSIGGSGASSSWGSIDITGSKGGWQGIHFKDYGYVWMVRNDGYTGMWKNAGNAVFAFDQNGSLATGSVPWSKLSGVPSSFTPSSHNHDTVYMRQASANGYWGMTANGSASDWVRTTTSGIIPYQSGTTTSSLGTDSWRFKDAHIQNIYEGGSSLASKYAAISHGHDNYISGNSTSGSTKITNANDVWKSGFYDLSEGTNVPYNGWTWLINSAHTNNAVGYKYGFQIAAQNTSNNFAMRTTNVNGEGTWNTLWHSNNFNPNTKASLGADVSFSIVRATSNGNGTNFAIGDDCWLGDINESYTVKLHAQDGSGKGFLRFGNGAKVGYNGGTSLEIGGGLDIFGTCRVADRLYFTQAETGYWLAASWYGEQYCVSAPNITTGRVHSSNWVYCEGNTGLYFSKHGGGWFMEDSTWVRSYNNRSIYTAGTMRCDSEMQAKMFRLQGAPGEPAFMHGGGDSANFSYQNIRLNCWYGFGIQAYDNKTRIFFNGRNGDIAATGNIYTSDGHGEGRISGFEPNRGNGRSRIAQGSDNGTLRIELFNNSTITGEYVLDTGSFWNRNSAPLGNPNFRWGQVYSTSGSISTSDSRLKENITPISKSQVRTLSDDDTPTSYDFYNYIKGASTYTFNYKKRYTQDTQTWLGVLADEIPDNIFDKVGTWSKTEEEYKKELEEKENAIATLENMPQLLFDDEREEYDFGNKIVEGTRMTFRELKQKAEEHVEEPVRMLNSSSQIAMLQEVLSIALNKIESLENILKEKGLY